MWHRRESSQLVRVVDVACGAVCGRRRGFVASRK